jgi:olefin beta-lactone synthetase
MTRSDIDPDGSGIIIRGLPPPPSNANIARHLELMAARRPQAPAIKIPRGRSRGGDIDYLAFTFAELSAEARAWTERLASRGVHRGDRTLLAVRPGLPLIACAFALFRLGAVPVVIDPGMGWRNLLACVARTRPQALVGVPIAQLISRIFRGPFRSIAVRVTADRSLTASLAPRPAQAGGPPPAIAESAPRELAAILFTSGSTGSPKGVCYEHGMFEAQVNLLRQAYGIEPGEVDMPMLAIFALFDPALGMTAVVPEIDPRRPSAVDPAKIAQAIRQEGVTNSFGSPTLWRIVGDHCRARGIKLPSLRRVLCAGAPVPSALWDHARDFLPNGRLHSPYGATEALPVSSIDEDEAVSLARAPNQGGAPVGSPMPGMEVKIIAISDDPISSIGGARILGPGEIGEIIVAGPVVTREYDALPGATALAKILGAAPGPESFAETRELGPGPGAPVWHRMGDCGYLDSGGKLWFCGRKAERVETPGGTMHTEPCERVFRGHPRAARCALIGLGGRGVQEPAMVVESRVRNAADGRLLAAELRALGLQHRETAAIRRFYFRGNFPVDVRHNAKIHRLALARWAATPSALRRSVALD